MPYIKEFVTSAELTPLERDMENLTASIMALAEDPLNDTSRAIVAMTVARFLEEDVRVIMKRLEKLWVSRADNKMLAADVYGLRRSNADLREEVARLRDENNKLCKPVESQDSLKPIGKPLIEVLDCQPDGDNFIQF